MTKAVNQKFQYDYSALGLKCGLELHQQLDTGRKLFCHCKTDLRLDDPQVIITRYMRPTLSELGEYDKAALMEFKKKKEIIYQIHDSVCSYEIDETPPFDPDQNAIDLAIIIARLLQMDILDELHVNRKQYLDGSIPTGFQRTMIVGIGGKVKAAGRMIALDMLALEEDSCREISNIGRTITWRVDRLGTPLVEIATKILTINDPEEIKAIAEGIGRILRVTGKVKRGIGTIRQDLNISIEKGSRVEIKGIQVLDMLPEYVKLEVERQLALVEIGEQLKKKGFTSDDYATEFKDCKEIFNKTSSEILKEAIKEKKNILGVKLPGLKGFLGKKVQLEKSFGKEIAERVKVITGLGGILHTDELSNYDITGEELESLFKFFNCKSNDAVAIVIGSEEETITAISEIITRVKEIFEGVPEETRHANEDGTTSFRRYLGGAGRMYPDTDSYPIVISDARIKRIEDELPELPDKKEERFLKDLNLPEEMAKGLAISPRAELFDELVKLNMDPMLVAVTLEQTIKALAREDLPVDNLTDKRIKEIFELLKNKKIAKEAIEPLLKHFTMNPQDRIDSVLELLGLEIVSEEQLEEIIDAILNKNASYIQENGQRALGKIMGQVMELVRGKIDGKTVNELLNKKFIAKMAELEK